MELNHLNEMLQYKSKEVLKMFKLTKSLTYTQAQINLLVGECLLYEPSTRKTKEYLEYLDILDLVNIKGLPGKISDNYLYGWIQSYYKSLEKILHHSRGTKVKDLVANKINEFVRLSFDKYAEVCIKNYKAQENNRFIAILDAWASFAFPYSTSKFLFKKFCGIYLNEHKISLKYEKIHLLLFSTIITVLKSHPQLFKKQIKIVSKLFCKAQSTCKKYILHKINKEKVYLICCEYIILTLSNPDVISLGLVDVTLPAIFSKTCYAESYLLYFFKQTYTVLQRPSIATRLLLCAKDYLMSYLRHHTEYISPALSSFHENLKISQEPELIATLVGCISDVFNLSDFDTKANVIVPYLFLCFNDLPKKISSEIFQLALTGLTEDLYRSLGSVFSKVYSVVDEDNIIWIKKVAQSIPPGPSAAEVIKNLNLSYINYYTDDTICQELSKTFTVFADLFPADMILEIINTICEMLILHEKHAQIKHNPSESKKIISKAFGLLNIAKICCIKNPLIKKSHKMLKFWCLITHFKVHYTLNHYISVIELDENLEILSKITPYLLSSTENHFPSVFLHLFQSQSYSKGLETKLKSYLASIVSKKMVENLDYTSLLVSATIYNLLKYTPKTIIPVGLYYLSLESLPISSLVSEFISQIVSDHWKDLVNKNITPTSDIISLLKGCASAQKSVRVISMKLIYSSSNSAAVIFPSIFYSYQGIATALDMIGGLNLESSIEYSSSIPLLYLPHSNSTIPLPTSKVIIKDIYSFIQTYINETLLKALCQGPKRVLSAFAYYLYYSNKLIKNTPNLKISAITNFGISVFNHNYYSSKIFPIDKFHILKSYLLPEKFHNWYLQQKPSIGYFLPDESLLQLQCNYLSIADALVERNINEYLIELRKYVTEESVVDTKNSIIFDLLGRIAGILIIKNGDFFPSDLVHIPLKNPSPASIAAGVFCWDWLASSMPQIRISLFQELYLGWKNFICRQGLLLKQTPRSRTNPLINYSTIPAQNITGSLENILIVLEFIQLQVYSTSDSSIVHQYLIKIIAETLEDKINPEVMNYEPGLEIILRLAAIVTDLLKHFSEQDFNALGLKLLEFLLSGFIISHSWVKSSSMEKYNLLKDMFETCLDNLSSIKLKDEPLKLNKKADIEDLNTWDIRETLAIHYKLKTLKTQIEPSSSTKKDIVILLLYHQYQRFIAWNSVQKFQCVECPKHSNTSKLAKYAYELSNKLGVVFSKAIKSNRDHSQDNNDEFKFLFCLPDHLPLSIDKLDSSSSSERSYHLKLLKRSSERCKLYYMQQVLQCGKPQNLYEEYKRIQAEEDVWTYLTICAKESSVFLNQLIWMLEVSLFNPTENLEKTLGNKYYHIILEVIKENIEEWDQFNLEQKYFEKFLLISSTLVPKSPENTNIINQELQKLSKNIPEGLYIPTNPNKYVIGLRDDNGRPLQSAKRTPILVTFYTKSKDDDETDTTQCIFKVNDDVRNDQLCLQVIDLMKEILYQANLKIYLRPYKVISTITHTNDGPQLSGIIECIPNCKSRDEIGKEGIQSLYTYFIDKFGQETSDGYIEAKKNFIASLAGYAIASYMLQIKDRHNGNILIDEFGHIVHIDFGFILNISPGGNMRFERPGFKLTQEMIDVMGKSDTESFEYFKSLVTKGYLAIREHAYSFIAIVSKMEFSGLTCFRKGAVNNFIKRFYLKFSLPEAIKKINEKISRANNSFFTLWYDRIQLMQQQIEY